MTNEFQSRFHKNFRWALVGSIVYEITKTLHNFFLAKLLLPEQYGALASLLSLTYFITKVADLGAGTSLLPFFGYITQNKQAFKSIITKHYLLPHIPLAITITTISILLLHKSIPTQSGYMLGLIGLVIILETIRSFLRLFLYTAMQTRYVVVFEVSTFLGFVLSVFGPFFISNSLPSFKTVFISHIIESTVTVILLSALFVRFYKALPSVPSFQQQPLKFRMIKTKILNYTLRLSREFFSAHFLTPFFAFKFGFEYAGVFYFATVIAQSMHSVFKVSVGYLGNALFAALKNSSSHDKQTAFSILCQKTSKLLVPIIIFLIINSNKIVKYTSSNDLSSIAVILPLIFLLILTIDFIMSIYEQFYIAEEEVEKFLGLKIIEFMVFMILIKTTTAQTSPLFFLTEIILVKVLCLLTIGLCTFKVWKIKLGIDINKRQIAVSTILSLIISLVL